jgi:hypothetical protein
VCLKWVKSAKSRKGLRFVGGSCSAMARHAPIMDCRGYGESVCVRGVCEVKSSVATFAERIATLSSGLFAGAAVYINLVEHPARMETGIRPALQFSARVSKPRILAALNTRGWRPSCV